MFLSALLKSFSQIAREKSRRQPTGRVAMMTEQFEGRQLLSAVTILGSDFPRNSGGGSTGGGSGGPLASLTNLPVLNSRPGAPVSVILKLDGYTDSDPGWIAFRNRGTGPIVTPAFDLDSDATTYNTEELRQIEEIWYRVAEDFAPFNINVTTIAPPTLNDFEHVMVIIGGDNDWAPTAGGWGFVNGFSTGAANTNYVFSKLFFNPHQIASASSHESGHTFGLLHQSTYDASGTKTDEYNPGDANIAPIMGVGYGTIRDTWWNGPNSTSSTTIQDDLAQLTRPANQTVQYRVDDYGNTIATASNIVVTGPVITRQGVIEQNNDVDMFKFETATGRISFTAEGLNLKQIYNNGTLTFGTNIDLEIRLYNSTGAIIATAAPTDTLFATFSMDVTQGTYHVGVSNAGRYGDVGQYTLSGTVIPLPSIPTMVSPSGTILALRPVFQWSLGANAVSYELEVDNLTTSVNGYYETTSTTNSTTSAKIFNEGNYRARVRAVASNGTFSAWSPYLLFTVNVPTPATPTIIRPRGTIGESFPTFEWTKIANATRYELIVTRAGNNQRIIYRTNYGPTSYVHFSPLVDGTYNISVRAGNSVNEFSAWSASTALTVKSPIPAAPKITAPTRVTTSTNPRLVWAAVDGVAWYDLKVDNLSTAKTDFIRQTRLPRALTYFDPSYMTQGNYRAHVRGVNGNGVPGAWSPAYLFEVNILPPAAPLLTGPRGADDSPTITTTNPLFTWSQAARAVKYELLVNNLTTQTSKVISENNIRTNFFRATANMPQGNYRAWVRGINVAGEVGRWSPGLDFTVDEPTPAVPVIVAPSANSLNFVEDSNPTFVWEAEPPAFAYDFTLFNVTLNKSAFTVRGLSDTQYTVTTAQRLGEYTYRALVRSVNSSGDVSDWSRPFTIQVDVPNATTPTLIGPGGTLTDRTPIFSWVHTSTSFRYELLIRDLVRREDITLQVTSFQVSPGGRQASYTLPDARALIPSTYRFWVRAFNSQGQASGWSTSMSFVIAAQLNERLLVPDQNEVEELALLASFRTVPPVAVEEASAAQRHESQDVEYSEESQGLYYSTNPGPGSSTAGPPQAAEQLAFIDAVMGGIADPSVVMLDLSKNNS